MKLITNLLGALSPLSFLLNVWRQGEFVGEDQIGNKYYRSNPRKGYKHDRRFVVYNGDAQASLVPPEWHGWLHHQTDNVPSDQGASYRKPWQIGWKPNMTGTENAYLPPGDIRAGGKRDAATGDYEPWRPEGATNPPQRPEGATKQHARPE